MLLVCVGGRITGCTSAASSSNLPPAGNQMIELKATANGVLHPLNLRVNITN